MAYQSETWLVEARSDITRHRYCHGTFNVNVADELRLKVTYVCKPFQEFNHPYIVLTCSNTYKHPYILALVLSYVEILELRAPKRVGCRPPRSYILEGPGPPTD